LAIFDSMDLRGKRVVIVGAGFDGEDLCYPLRAVFRNTPNVRVLMRELLGGDLDAKVLELADGENSPMTSLSSPVEPSRRILPYRGGGVCLDGLGFSQ